MFPGLQPEPSQGTWGESRQWGLFAWMLYWKSVLVRCRMVCGGRCSRPRPQAASRQAGCGQDNTRGQLVCFAGSQACCPFKGKGSAISLALGVNGLAWNLLMAFAGCAFSMRSFQNYIPMKLYFAQDVKLDLCKSTGTKNSRLRVGQKWELR